MIKNIKRLFTDVEYRKEFLDYLLDYLIDEILLYKAKLLFRREKRYIDEKKVNIIYSKELLEYRGIVLGALRVPKKEIIIDPILKGSTKDFVIGHEAYHLFLDHAKMNSERDLKIEMEADLMSAKMMINDLGYTKKEVIKAVKGLLVFTNQLLSKKYGDNKRAVELLMGEYKKEIDKRIEHKKY
ncbi:hypothetical protein C8C76_1653 [Halanaerobium saccharolyticum]|uniref:IrrE N-terminal-like domain-containing protein n=1 Tax=Halanaerobium saccharolyticum TaxID=43595 RepID=A0A2T5RF48_9FIRM|nr:hypothetical protein [Halanaerobium saccharolyticum]PTV92840.1 hypothetical protein C8C76_1653 [Halanaerobium saccharolyticum]